MINNTRPRSVTPDAELTQDPPDSPGSAAPETNLASSSRPPSAPGASGSMAPRNALPIAASSSAAESAPGDDDAPPFKKRRVVHANPLGFSPAELEQIGNVRGGSQLLAHVAVNQRALSGVLTKDQVLQIALQPYAIEALDLIARHAAKLQSRLGLDAADLVAIATRGTVLSLSAVHKHAQALSQLGLSPAQLLKIASAPGGSSTIAKVATAGAALMQPTAQGGLAFSAAELTALASESYVATSLEFIFEQRERFNAGGVTAEQIVAALVNNPHKKLAVESLLQTFGRALETYSTSDTGLSPDEEREILDARGGDRALRYVKEHRDELQRLLSPSQLVNVAGRDNGEYRLSCIRTLHDTLTKPPPDGPGLDMKDIVQAATGRSAVKTLPMLAGQGAALRQLGFGAVQLAAIAGANHGLASMESLCSHASALLAQPPQGPGLSCQQVVAIVTGRGLDAAAELAKKWPKIASLEPDVHAIVALALQSEGAKKVRRYCADLIAQAARVPVAEPPVVVKVEPASPSGAGPEPLPDSSIRLDQARTAFVPQIPHCDLTGEIEKWSVQLDHDNAVVLREAMDPIGDNDHEFVLRDPDDPLNRVHPRYAGDDGRCHRNVGVVSVSQFRGNLTELKSLFARDPRVPRKTEAEARSICAAVAQDVERELQRLVAGTPAPRPCSPRRLTAVDVKPHEQMLIGRYGLFVDPTVPAEQRPLLSNGRILGLYMGSLVDADEQLPQLEQDHPDYVDYVMSTTRRDPGRPRRSVLISGDGAINSIGFANTALLPGTDKAAFDHSRLNAFFLEFDVVLTGKDGQPHPEAVVAAVALDNLYAEDNPTGQVLIDYSDSYLPVFDKLNEKRAAEDAAMLAKVKPEPLDG